MPPTVKERHKQKFGHRLLPPAVIACYKLRARSRTMRSDGHDRKRGAILRVADLVVSRRYYVDILGFTADWDAGAMISVSRDGKPIMICEGAQGQPGTWLWVGVEDAEALFGEFSLKGARVRSPPQNFYWAYEFQIEDPDGHVLRFGSEPKPGPKSGVFNS
jgi:catechol 2,3-dioxygenase-like lactoylglutathione lyase family enzyme